MCGNSSRTLKKKSKLRVFKNIKLRVILKFEKTKISEDEENYAVRNLIFTIHQIVR
jgi:hypothetical protein